MQRLPLWIRSTVGCQPRANDADLYLPLQQDFAELLSRQLPDDAFHLQIKERSQNFGRIQAGAFHNIINVHRLLGANLLNARQFLLSALETFLLHDGFGDLRREMAGLEIGKCARKTPSGESNRRSTRADKGEAKPGVSASASQGREVSDCIAGRAYAQSNRLVK